MLPMESVVKRWEDAYQVAPWLSDFFSTEDGRGLMEALRTESEKDSRPDPEILPFILICYVLPEPYWERLPPLADRKRIARLLTKAAREIRDLSTSNVLGPSESTSGAVDQLTRWGSQLRGQPRLQISGKLQIIDERPFPKRHRAKRRVVFFLDGYFRAIGRISPPWEFITKVLKATKLVESNAKEKDVATWWSTAKKRDLRVGKTPEPAQDKHVQLFYDLKKQAAEGCEGIVLKWEAEM